MPDIGLGIFAKTFVRPDVAGCLAAVADAGIPATQFNLSVVGLPTVPNGPVPDPVINAVRSAATSAGVALAAISGTFNAAHPDPAYRRAYVGRFPHLCAAAAELGIPIVTLCSGSRDPDDLWRHHPDNATTAAWADSRATLRALADIAEEHGVVLAVEPEHGNVLATADLAVAMIDQIGSPDLRVVYDAGNLLDPDGYDPAAAADAIERDVAALAPHLVLAHAKELAAGRRPAAPGEGLLPWDVIVRTLARNGFGGTFVIHGLPESGVPLALATLEAACTESRTTPPRSTA